MTDYKSSADTARGRAGSPSLGAATKPPPAFMYVHYLTEDHKPSYPAFLFQLVETETIEKQIQDAVADIVAGTARPLREGAYGVEWRVYSYVAFVLHDEEILTEVKFAHKVDGSNKTFTCAGETEGDGWTCKYYLNKRLNKDGNDLGPEGKETFKWETFHSRKAAASPTGIDAHTSSGTNIGP